MKNTKIAIVADIHANKYALNTFLDFINKNNINKILNLGDFLQIGPNPQEVTNIVLNNNKFINILGNNETSLFEINYKDLSSENEHRVWTRKQVEEYFDKIEEIPYEKEVNINGISFFMIHARKNDIKGTPLIYTENLKSFENDYRDCNSKVILFGHTHKKIYIEENNKLYLNPGSLGCSFNNSVDFAILEIGFNEIQNCSFISLKYDYSLLIKDFFEKDVPDKEFLIKNFFKN